MQPNAAIEKSYGRDTIMRLGNDHGRMAVESDSTGYCHLILLGVGGIPRGRIIEIFGSRRFW
ncbi:MAG: hypothetical protein R2883_06070 [Caldisericia bacterium]